MNMYWRTDDCLSVTVVEYCIIRCPSYRYKGDASAGETLLTQECKCFAHFYIIVLRCIFLQAVESHPDHLPSLTNLAVVLDRHANNIPRAKEMYVIVHAFSLTSVDSHAFCCISSSLRVCDVREGTCVLSTYRRRNPDCVTTWSFS